jgi:hypothetical protein
MSSGTRAGGVDVAAHTGARQVDDVVRMHASVCCVVSQVAGLMQRGMCPPAPQHTVSWPRARRQSDGRYACRSGGGLWRRRGATNAIMAPNVPVMCRLQSVNTSDSRWGGTGRDVCCVTLVRGFTRGCWRAHSTHKPACQRLSFTTPSNPHPTHRTLHSRLSSDRGCCGGAATACRQHRQREQCHSHLRRCRAPTGRPPTATAARPLPKRPRPPRRCTRRTASC